MKVMSQICIVSKDLYVDVIFNDHAEVFIYKFCNMELQWFITNWQKFLYAVKYSKFVNLIAFYTQFSIC